MRFGFIAENGLCLAEFTQSVACSGPTVNINWWSELSLRHWGVSDVVTGKYRLCLEGATAFGCNVLLSWATLGTALPAIWFLKRGSNSNIIWHLCYKWQLIWKLTNSGLSETNPRADVAINLKRVVYPSFLDGMRVRGEPRIWLYVRWKRYHSKSYSLGLTPHL